MRLVFLLIVLTCASLAAEKKPSKAVKTDPPAGAVKVSDTFYRYTDARGKKWAYRKTPFGWSKAEEAAEAAAPAPKSGESELRVVADGEVVKFEKPSPFGVSRWERKTDELKSDEKAALARYREQRAAQK